MGEGTTRKKESVTVVFFFFLNSNNVNLSIQPRGLNLGGKTLRELIFRLLYMKKDEHYVVELTGFSFNTKTNLPIGGTAAGCSRYVYVTLTIDFRRPTVYSGSMEPWYIIFTRLRSSI